MYYTGSDGMTSVNEKLYKVALYLRLSRDDGEAGESESIANQSDLLTRYVLAMGWSVYDVYADDGCICQSKKPPHNII